MLIVYHGAAGPRQRARFEETAATTGDEIVICDPADTDHLAELLPRMNVWWHVLTPITAEHLSVANELRLIQKWGVGVNTIDVAEATRRGVATANMPGSNATAVAEASLGLLLAVFRQLPTYHQATLGGAGWTIPAEAGERCREVAGARVGLVGYGDIAQRFGSTVTAMGAEVRHHSTRSDRPGWMPLADLAAWSEVLSIHVPLTPDTDGLVNADILAALPDRAVVVNTSRGGVLDNAALAAELLSGRLGGAGLDVFADEPWTGPDPLRDAPNVVCTPHVAWLTWETLERSLEIATDNVARVGRGEPLRYQVG